MFFSKPFLTYFSFIISLSHHASWYNLFPPPSHLPSVLATPPPKILSEEKKKIRKETNLIMEAVVYHSNHAVNILSVCLYLQMFIAEESLVWFQAPGFCYLSVLGPHWDALGYYAVLLCCGDPAALVLMNQPPASWAPANHREIGCWVWS